MTNDEKPTLQRCKRRLDKTKRSAIKLAVTNSTCMDGQEADKNDLMKNASNKLIEDKDNRAPTIREAMYKK